VKKTLRDVAKKAGVSTCTVSHALNKTRPVRPETRKRIKAAVRELRYQPNLLARSLRRSQTKTIGLVLSDIDNPFFTRIARAVQDACLPASYQVILCNTDEDIEKERAAIRTLFGSRVDGIILAPAAGDHKYLKEYSRLRFPLVTINRRISVPKLPGVISNNEEGARIGMEHLIGHGHRRIGVIIGMERTSTTEDRMRGLRTALAKRGLPFDRELVRSGKLVLRGGYEVTRHFMDLADPPTAIFAFNNVMAEGAMLALRDMRLPCPDKVALMGYDDFRSAAALEPSLTVVAQPTKEMGEKAVNLLLQLIASDRLSRKLVILPTSLIHRASCGCPPERTGGKAEEGRSA
jgi:LacI family transcriptional regulator